jgi:CBS domain-containing protein
MIQSGHHRVIQAKRFIPAAQLDAFARTAGWRRRVPTQSPCRSIAGSMHFLSLEARKMLGIVTKFDFLQAFAFTTSQIVPHFDELMRRTVADVMTEAVVHVEPAASLTRILQLMVDLKSRSFPVIGSEGQLVGMISREDVMRALKETTREDRL